jgi:hypothetical protein
METAKKNWRFEDDYDLSFLPSPKERRARIDYVLKAVDIYAKITAATRFEIGKLDCELVVYQADGHLELFELATVLWPELEYEQERARYFHRMFQPLIPEEKICQYNDIDNAIGSIGWTGVDLGFYIGQLFGARMAGASDTEMQRLAELLDFRLGHDGRYALRELRKKKAVQEQAKVSEQRKQTKKAKVKDHGKQ